MSDTVALDTETDEDGDDSFLVHADHFHNLETMARFGAAVLFGASQAADPAMPDFRDEVNALGEEFGLHVGRAPTDDEIASSSGAMNQSSKVFEFTDWFDELVEGLFEDEDDDDDVADMDPATESVN